MNQNNTKQNKTKKQARRYIEHTGGCQRRGRQEVVRVGKDGQKVQTFNYKISKSWVYNIHPTAW